MQCTFHNGHRKTHRYNNTQPKIEKPLEHPFSEEKSRQRLALEARWATDNRTIHLCSANCRNSKKCAKSPQHPARPLWQRAQGLHIPIVTKKNTRIRSYEMDKINKRAEKRWGNACLKVFLIALLYCTHFQGDGLRQHRRRFENTHKNANYRQIKAKNAV